MLNYMNEQARIIQKYLKTRLVRERIQLGLMNNRLIEMGEEIERLQKAQQEKALVPIVFQMKKFAKAMHLKRMAHIKTLLALAIKKIMVDKNKNKKVKKRRFTVVPNKALNGGFYKRIEIPDTDFSSPVSSASIPQNKVRLRKNTIGNPVIQK